MGQVMLLIGNPEDILTVLKGYKSPILQAQPQIIPETEQPKTIDLQSEMITEAIPEKPKLIPPRYCGICGVFLEPDDSVLDYQIDDGIDVFHVYYHADCEPDDSEFAGYKSSKLIGEMPASEIGKTKPSQKKPEKKPKNDSLLQKVHRCLLQADHSMTCREIADCIGEKNKSVSGSLFWLKKQGDVVGEGKPLRYRIKEAIK